MKNIEKNVFRLRRLYLIKTEGRERLVLSKGVKESIRSSGLALYSKKKYTKCEIKL